MEGHAGGLEGSLTKVESKSKNILSQILGCGDSRKELPIHKRSSMLAAVVHALAISTTPVSTLVEEAYSQADCCREETRECDDALHGMHIPLLLHIDPESRTCRFAGGVSYDCVIKGDPELPYVRVSNALGGAGDKCS